MSDSIRQSQPDIFPFLSLPLELRWMVYRHALSTPHGLWMDTYRRDIPGFLRKKNYEPAASDLLAAEGLHGIITPALLRVCSQIHHEAKHYINNNQWRLNRWSARTIADIPQSVRDKVQALFLGRDPSGSSAPDGTPSNQFESPIELISSLPNVQHITLGMLEDDKGLSGTPKPGDMVVASTLFERQEPWSRFHIYKYLFQRGSFKSISLECMWTYPSCLYPWVYLWSWVTTMSWELLPHQVQPKLKEPLREVTSHLGFYDNGFLPTYRNYAPLLDSSNERTAVFRTLLCRLREVWEDFGVRVYARDPTSYERGTMVVFERM
ncbi:uncharacterized protein N7482_008365 [Penicillium canariense]|uniref:2EXR domain-containing protein n=1 Tax=Penicillium canariense TaxID=189055 RepID=A0A9W9HVV2_9EURO|nr:uncharacterized protein N7482_008365 [Penicillium canariense]KAJ5157265.1 hypothetical protein N7482_008365 [Penicillium canariense]